MVRSVALLVILVAACGRLGFSPSTGDGGLGDGTNAADGVPPKDGVLDPDGRLAIDEMPLLIPDVEFNRENASSYRAAVSTFKLDRYEVTVRRFRPFVEGGFGVQGTAPTVGMGMHPIVTGSGWDVAWNTQLEPDTVTFRTKLISTARSTYSPTPGSKDALPIVNASWFEAFAFCIWDGGRLPTYAEYQAAVLGGDEQRVYPWGPEFDPARLALLESELVGSHPTGDGRWGHADLVGNVDEWLLDETGPLPTPCSDCALIGDSTSARALGGWHWGEQATTYANGGAPHGASPTSGFDRRGFRCAR